MTCKSFTLWILQKKTNISNIETEKFICEFFFKKNTGDRALFITVL